MIGNYIRCLHELYLKYKLRTPEKCKVVTICPYLKEMATYLRK